MKAGVAQLYLGCPVWACVHWRGTLFPARAPSRSFLEHYAQAFNTVEGNSSFYAMPTPAQMRGWRAQVQAQFRFCFKFPAAITHTAMLDPETCAAATAQFLESVSALDDTLGPLMLQLGPRFGPEYLPRLAGFLRQLPTGLPLAVDVRHPAFFAAGKAEAAFDALLRDRGCDRVLFDTRALHAHPASDPSSRAALARKPQLPLRDTLTATRPLLRLVLPIAIEQACGHLDEWAVRIAAWLQAGHTPYVFIHTPDDVHAPRIAVELHRRIRALYPGLPELPAWPTPPAAEPQQLALF